MRWRWKGCAPNINAGLHPTLAICQCLNGEFVLVVGREVSAVMLQPVHDEVAFLSRKESSSSWVLFSQPKMFKKKERRERWERRETYIVHGEICNTRHGHCDKTFKQELCTKTSVPPRNQTRRGTYDPCPPVQPRDPFHLFNSKRQ